MKEPAGDYLVDLAKRLVPECDAAAVRTVFENACGGQLETRRTGGRRASTLTSSGSAFEPSVSGGRGVLAPVLRYLTESGTQKPEYTARLASQFAAIPRLASWLPDGAGRKAAALLRTFFEALYPDPAALPARYGSFNWTGIVHGAESPRGIVRLKAYGRADTQSALGRLCKEFPGFTDLGAAPGYEKFIRPVFATIEVDAHGEINHKVYLLARRDVAAPMKLLRCFGDPVWELLSEFERHGLAPADFYSNNFFVCRSRGTGAPAITLHVNASRHTDLTELVGELAERHHGTRAGVEALTRSAAATGATVRYSAVGLGFSVEHGIDKLNVYGVPTWPVDNLHPQQDARRTARP